MTREYFTEGEYVPGSPAQPYYYGPDQIGSVRRVFASTASAPAYSYDPYGNALQGTAPLTDFNYAGMFYNADSGLYLTQYRAYDPVSGRWLSRDPLGEAAFLNVAPMNALLRGQVSPTFGPYGFERGNLIPVSGQIDRMGFDPAANLYRYVEGNPVAYVDPSGDQWANVAGAAAGCIGGFGGSIIEQGFNQTFGGSPCPPAINVKQAIAACLAGAFVGAFNPASGFRQFVTVVLAGVYGGAITGGLSPFF